jgi:hypothetical protein
MNDYKKLEQEINKIKNRNSKVELEKAWETSLFRKVLITILTYIIIVLFFYFANLPKPFINAIVPTIGFILSTLSIQIFKNIWIKYFYKKYK